MVQGRPPFRVSALRSECGAGRGTQPIQARPASAGGSHPEGRNGARNERSGGPALARVASDGSIKVSESFEAGVPFFVWAEVPRWRQLPIPAAVRSFEDLERFVPKAATAAGLDADQPLPFLVEGREELIEFHIVNRVGDGPHNMEMHKKIQITFEREKVQATIIGFHSTKHRGIFTPGDSNIHIHFQTPDNSASGHIQKLQLGDGAILSLPERAV